MSLKRINSGRFYGHDGVPAAPALLVNGEMRVAIFRCIPATILKVGIDVTVGSTAANFLRMVGYSMGPDGMPLNLLFDSGAVDSAAVQFAQNATVSKDVIGSFWLGIVQSGAPAAAATVRMITPVEQIGGQVAGAGAGGSILTVTGVTAAPPVLFPTAGIVDSNATIGRVLVSPAP